MNINEVRSEFFPEVRWGINRPWLGIAQTSVLYIFFRFHFIIRLFIFMFIDLLIPSPSLLDDRLYGFSRPIILRPASMELTLFPLSTGNHRGFFFCIYLFYFFFPGPQLLVMENKTPMVVYSIHMARPYDVIVFGTQDPLSYVNRLPFYIDRRR